MVNLADYDDIRNEMLNGKIVAMSPRPSVNHNIVAGNIYSIFKIFLKGKPCVAFTDGVDVYLSEKDRVIPDAMIVCNKDIIKKNGIHGTPDLLVEVLSPSTAKNDRGYKKKLYEKSGVKEYWIVEIESRSIEVYLLENSQFELYEVYSIVPEYIIDKMTDEEKDNIIYEFTTSLNPDFKIILEDVFENVL